MLALGIDAGHETVTIALLESAGRTPRVAGIWREARDPGRPLAEQLRALIDRSCPARPDAVATALPGSAVSHRILRLPFADPGRLAATVPFELESLVPFDVETGLIAFTVLDRDTQGASVLAAIVPEDEARRHLAEMAAAGLDPAVVDLGALAVAGLLRLESPDVLVLDPRSDGAVVLFRGGRLAAVRVVDGPSLEERAQEARWAALALLDGQAIPPVLVVSPAGAARGALAGLLAEETPALAAQLPAWAAGTSPSDLRAVALAGRAAGLVPLGLNFRTGAFSYHAPSEEARRQLRITGGLAAAALLIGLLAFGAAVAERRAELAGLREEVARAVSGVLPGAAPGTERTRLEGAIDTLAQRREVLGGASVGRPSTLDLLRSIADAVPDQVPVAIEDIAVDDDGVRLHARTDSYESVDVVKRSLQNVPGLRNPQVKDVKAGVDGRIEFRVGLAFASETQS